MTAGQIICGIYWCAMVCLAGILAVQPVKLRKDKIWVKCLLAVAVLFMLGLNVANTFFVKFSSIEYTITSIYSFLILLIFFKVRFWQLFAVHFFIWINLELVRRFGILICCFKEEIIFWDYLTSKTISWHLVDIIVMLFTVAILILILHWKKGKTLIKCRFQREYVVVVILILIELGIQQVIFTMERAQRAVSLDYVILVCLALMVVFSSSILLVITKYYRESRYEEKITKTGYEVMKQQYDMLQELYTEKRRILHDTAHQYIVIDEYIRTGKIEQARNYIGNMLNRVNAVHTKTYTGVSVIDIMLDYKMKIARQQKIQIESDFDVHFCPLEGNDMCVLLGNLLDNAIEAVQDLPEKFRPIHIVMKTANNIFIMEIQNPYEGKRHVIEGKYKTTKEDKDVHGIGLESVERIVNHYQGALEIVDDGHNFSVIVNIWSGDNNRELKGNLSEIK